MWRSGWTARSCSCDASGASTTLAAEPVVALHLGLERDDPLGPLGVAGHVVGERELVAQPDGPGHPDTVGLSVERADLIVVGAGAAGLYAAL